MHGKNIFSWAAFQEAVSKKKHTMEEKETTTNYLKSNDRALK